MFNSSLSLSLSLSLSHTQLTQDPPSQEPPWPRYPRLSHHDDDDVGSSLFGNLTANNNNNLNY